MDLERLHGSFLETSIALVCVQKFPSSATAFVHFGFCHSAALTCAGGNYISVMLKCTGGASELDSQQYTTTQHHNIWERHLPFKTCR